jgi:septum formation protein
MIPQNLPWTLASASPRRATLLRNVGIEPTILPAEIDEIGGGDPGETALKNAVMKADAVSSRVVSGLLLAADTVVIVNDDVLGKPDSAEHAREMLDILSGREHEVLTAYSLRWVEHGFRADDTETTRVKMRTFMPAERDRYISSGESSDKAGAYGIQGGAAAFVTGVEGCYFNVVGLPIAAVLHKVVQWIYSQREQGA